MEKKKKRLIIVSIIAGTLVLLVLLSSAIFKIKSVSIEYQTTLNLLSVEDLNKMVEESEIPYGKSIFFSSLDENIREMEESQPYIKVNKIERKFPNSLVVLVSERVPVVKVETTSGTYILDSDLKVLNIATNLNEFNSQTGENDLPKLVISEDFNKKVASHKKGEFVEDATVQKYVDAFYRGAVSPGKEDKSVAISLIHTIEEIKVGYVEELGATCFDITYGGLSVKSRIIGDNNLVDDIYKVLSAVSMSGDEYSEINCTDGVIYAKKA